MARKQPEIKTESFVDVGGTLTNTKDLTPEQKVKLATWIKMTWLNTIFQGQAEFYPEGEVPEDKKAHIIGTIVGDQLI